MEKWQLEELDEDFAAAVYNLECAYYHADNDTKKRIQRIITLVDHEWKVVLEKLGQQVTRNLEKQGNDCVYKRNSLKQKQLSKLNGKEIVYG